MVLEVQEELRPVDDQEVVQQEVTVLAWEQTQDCMAELMGELMNSVYLTCSWVHLFLDTPPP